MFLNKIKARESGVLLYGITPPKSQTEPEKINEIAAKTLARLYDLDLDALIIYDVQEETSRTAEERPFPFVNALDPFDFARDYLSSLEVPKIIYRPAGKFTKEELSVWLEELTDHGFLPVFVGIPSPDFQPVTSLPEAYQLWRQFEQRSVIGAVTIPERHALLKDEDRRMLDKTEQGVSYFVSQCVFDVEYAKDMLRQLAATCETEGCQIPTIIFTLTACGSGKTLEFMKWLGIHIPMPVQETLLGSENILDASVKFVLETAMELTEYCIAQKIPFGFNVESVAIRKSEIEASIYIFNQIQEMLVQKGIRNVAQKVTNE